MRVTGYVSVAVPLMWLWMGLVWPASGLLSETGSPRPQPCGPETVDPRHQCCCEATPHNIPEHDCQCCATEAFRWNETKPGWCMQRCGNQTFHSGTQLCCGETVFRSTKDRDVCCGKQVINTRHAVCCTVNGSKVALDSKNYRCCRRQWTPYHLSSMRCNRQTGKVMFKNRQRFQTGPLCDRRLTVLNHTWPVPDVNTQFHTHIRAIPDTCKLTKTQDAAPSGGVTTKVLIPMSSFAVVGRHQDAECLRASDTLELLVKVAPGQPCASAEELKAYLHGKVLDVVVRKGVVCLKSPLRPVLRLKEGHNAAIFVAGTSGAVMAQSLLGGGS